MKEPENFPDLVNPHYVLETPIIFQWLAIIFVITIPSIYFLWFYSEYQKRSLLVVEYFVLAGMILLFLLLFSRNLWRKWITFAADARGVYFASRGFSHYVHLPWENIGETSIGIGERRVKSVIMVVNVTEEKWQELIGKLPDARSLGSTQRSSKRKINIANNCRNVQVIRREIERIRMYSIH